jgi:putative transposase
MEQTRKSFLPPGAPRSRTFGYATLERWYYAHRAGGLEALRPTPRSDRGRARELTEAQRELLLEVRREHPAATASVILREMVASGRIDQGAVSEATVRRLFSRVPIAASDPSSPSSSTTKSCGYSLIQAGILP